MGAQPQAVDHTIVQGHGARAGKSRATRYHEVSNPPPDLEKVINALVRGERRKGYANPPALKGAVPGFPEYKIRGRLDDVIRFLRHHGVIVSFPAARPKCYLIDAERGQRLLQAVADGTELPASLKESHRRFLVLARAKGLHVNDVEPTTLSDDGERDEPENGDDFTTLDDSDLEPLSEETDGEPCDATDDSIDGVPSRVPGALHFLVGAQLEDNGAPLLADSAELGAFTDAELQVYDDAIADYVAKLEAMRGSIAVLVKQRADEEARRLAQVARQRAEEEVRQAERALAAADAEEFAQAERQRQATLHKQALVAELTRRKAALS